MAGRPKVLDEVKQANICALLAAGCSRRQAAKYVGCAPSTIGYLANGDRHFAKRMRQAEMQKEVRPLTNLMHASGQHWRAAAWLLERQFPNRYARRQPDLMTRQEFREAVSSLANALIDAVPATKDRLAVRRRIHDTLTALESNAQPAFELPSDGLEGGDPKEPRQPARSSRKNQSRSKGKSGRRGRTARR